jgi:hypothetical protein
MLRILYILLLILLHWSYWKVLTRLRGERLALTPILGWMAGLGYFLVAPLTLLVLNGGYTIPSFYDSNSSYASVDLSNGRYLLPMLVVWLALLFSFQAVLLLTRKAKTDEATLEFPINERKLRSILLLTFGLSVLDHAATIWRLGGVDAFLVSRWYVRQEDLLTHFGDAFVLYSWLSQANQILFTATAALHTSLQIQRRKLDLRLSALIVFALLLQMVMSGNRIFIALYGLSFLISCWFYRRKKLIAALLVVSPAILLLFSAWSYFRHDLSTISEDIPTYVEGDLGNRAMTTLMDTTEGVSVIQVLHMVNDFGQKFDYLYGLSYSKAVTFVLPRRLYPNKSQNFPVLIARLYEPGQVTSLGTTQLGELYANFGALSVLLLPFITALILLLSERLTRKIEKHVLLSAVLFVLLIWYARSSFEDNFITFLFALLMIRGLQLERGLCLPGQSRPASLFTDSL